MERVGYVGDIHGRTNWIKKLSEVAPLDHTVFMGDYLDTFDSDNTPVMQADNLMHILEIKMMNPDKITLLIGNHDLHYCDMTKKNYQSSGFHAGGSFMYHDIFKKHWDLFQIAHTVDGRLATHAGITKWWFGIWKKALGKDYAKEEDPFKLLVEPMNNYFQENHSKALDLISAVGESRGGVNISGGPLWCDKSELIRDPLPDLDQVVGHTQVEHTLTHFTDKGTKLTFCDNGLKDITVFEDIGFESAEVVYPIFK
jgi:predicted MPP superfamily phosphohydrolase